MNKEEPTIRLQRELLGSIGLAEEEEKMTPEEHKEYVSAIFAVFPRLEKDLKRFMKDQLLFSSTQAKDWEQVIFGRGTYNGLALMLEYWKQIANEHIHIENSKEDKFDEHSPIGEL